jgi:hypothetical protein
MAKAAHKIQAQKCRGKASERICASVVHPLVCGLIYSRQQDLPTATARVGDFGVRESNVPTSLYPCWYVNCCKEIKRRQHMVFTLYSGGD